MEIIKSFHQKMVERDKKVEFFKCEVISDENVTNKYKVITLIKLGGEFFK